MPAISQPTGGALERIGGGDRNNQGLFAQNIHAENEKEAIKRQVVCVSDQFRCTIQNSIFLNRELPRLECAFFHPKRPCEYSQGNYPLEDLNEQ